MQKANSTNIDIAIIGLSCRFPGASSAKEYWENLCNGVESVEFFSDQELLNAGVSREQLANPNYVKAAPTLPDIETFDAAFFGYSPKDAALMDPQQRLFLEVAWETFEDAGYDPAAYRGKVGVLSTCGGVVSSYLLAKLGHSELPGQTASISHINNDKDFLSTRVSFKLNLTGPSYTVQSACSSSLVAVHHACQNLRFQECDMMLVGGSVVRVPQVEGYLAEKRNLHSLDGHCRPFDAQGQGTIFGSGVGSVLLKPLDAALAEGDHIYAVIKGTAVNNDGSAKKSYTAPSLGPQAQCIIDALHRAGVSADSIGYIECHSTGTIVGDPLEIDALTQAFRSETAATGSCAVGSVKANIGHPEQAAGIAGIIKAALILHHRRIPPSINFDRPNPEIDFASSPFYVNESLCEFSDERGPRRVGLNSLGIGGTNAFAVLEESPSVVRQDNVPAEARPQLLTLSAKSAEALVANAEHMLVWLQDRPDVAVDEVCYTTNVSRAQFPFRLAIPGETFAQLKNGLEAWLQSVADGKRQLLRTSAQPVAFLFSGQGTQHTGMAAALYRTYPEFREALDRCSAQAKPYLSDDLINVIYPGEGGINLIDRTDYTQPALFAVEYALAELFKSWGITPSAVTGHSLGEFAAACSAGIMNVSDTMRLVSTRGALMQRLPANGAMASIFAGEKLVRDLMHEAQVDISIAALNGPINTVISGDQAAVQKLLALLELRDITYRELRISNGFHSALTEPVLDDLENSAADVAYDAPEVAFVSSLMGQQVPHALDKVYWRRHLRECVRFQDSMETLAELGCQTFLEIGPHPVLLPLAQVCLGDHARSATWTGSLNRQETDSAALSNMLAELYSAGLNVNWEAVHAPFSKHRIPLPTYAFQRKRHWIDSSSNPKLPAPVEPAGGHPLLGPPEKTDAGALRFETRCSLKNTGYLNDHRVTGTIVLPTTLELELAMAAGRHYFGSEQVAIEDVMHHQAMLLPDTSERLLQISVEPRLNDRASFEVSSKSATEHDPWSLLMTGNVSRAVPQAASRFSVEQVKANCRQSALSVAQLYDKLHTLGLEYGPDFRGITQIHMGQQEILTKVRLPETCDPHSYLLHPAFLDACLHAYPFGLDAKAAGQNGGDAAFLPVSLERYDCAQEGITSAWVHTVQRGASEDGSRTFDIRVFDMGERPVATLQGVTVQRLPLGFVQETKINDTDLFYRIAWRPAPTSSGAELAADANSSWIIFGDSGSRLGDALFGRLEALGHHCHMIYRGTETAALDLNRWTVKADEPRQFESLVKQILDSESLPCQGIVYLWGLDAPTFDDLQLETLQSGSEMICCGMLSVLQSLQANWSANAGERRLWLVTRCAQAVDTGAKNIETASSEPVQALLWGLGRTVALEYPGHWGGMIDLQCNGSPTQSVETLAAALLSPNGEREIALSGDQRYVSRFVTHGIENMPREPVRIDPNASYLIAGGLGMIGRSITKWLIREGAKHIVITGRSATPETAVALFNPGELQRADIRIVKADISREAEAVALLRTIETQLPPLKGIVHAAGVLDDGILANLAWPSFETVFHSRVYGSWLLHHYTQQLNLDFFLLNSSLLSLLGSAGQGNYTASSAFMDSLAGHRRLHGKPGTAINWCAWSEGGLATKSGARGEAMWSSLGVEYISPDTAMQAFDRLMQMQTDQIALAVADWPTYAAKVGHSTLLTELLDTPAPTALDPRPAQKKPEEVRHTKTSREREALLSSLQQHVMDELGYDETLDPDQPLNEVGLDSLMSVRLSNTLEKAFEVPVPVPELIKGPSLNQLIDELFNGFATATFDRANPAEEAVPSPLVRALSPPHAPRAFGTRETSDGSPVQMLELAGSEPSPVRAGVPHASAPARPLSLRTNDRRNQVTTDMLQQLLMSELGFDQEIDPEMPLNEVGLDSLMAVRVANRLDQEFEASVSVTDLISGPTINKLADMLAADEPARAQLHEFEAERKGGLTAAPQPAPANPANGASHRRPVTPVEEAASPVGEFELAALNGAAHSETQQPRQANGQTFERAVPQTKPENTDQDSAPPNGKAIDSTTLDAAPAPVTARKRTHTASTSDGSGRWLIAPQEVPKAKYRLFCFPYAGGGLASVRSWPEFIDDTIEVVAIEPPGRGTRIKEKPVRDMDSFVGGLMPELVQWLDRPSAFFGQCLGGLTMFATLRALPGAQMQHIKHAFACGIRAPHRLKRHGAFEDMLTYDMLLHPEFKFSAEPYLQSDDIFVDLVRRFDTPEADRMLSSQRLRDALLPTIRAEFGMAHNYQPQAAEPFRFPITSFVGDRDPWVSIDDSDAWKEYTVFEFSNHVRSGSHFLLAEDQDFIFNTVCQALQQDD